MSPKIGRPKADNPKEIRYSIRLDTETESKLQKYSELNGITKAQAIRTAINRLLGIKK